MFFIILYISCIGVKIIKVIYLYKHAFGLRAPLTGLWAPHTWALGSMGAVEPVLLSHMYTSCENIIALTVDMPNRRGLKHSTTDMEVYIYGFNHLR